MDHVSCSFCRNLLPIGHISLHFHCSHRPPTVVDGMRPNKSSFLWPTIVVCSPLPHNGRHVPSAHCDRYVCVWQGAGPIYKMANTVNNAMVAARWSRSCTFGRLVDTFWVTKNRIFSNAPNAILSSACWHYKFYRSSCASFFSPLFLLYILALNI